MGTATGKPAASFSLVPPTSISVVNSLGANSISGTDSTVTAGDHSPVGGLGTVGDSIVFGAVIAVVLVVVLAGFAGFAFATRHKSIATQHARPMNDVGEVVARNPAVMQGLASIVLEQRALPVRAPRNPQSARRAAFLPTSVQGTE